MGVGLIDPGTPRRLLSAVLAVCREMSETLLLIQGRIFWALRSYIKVFIKLTGNLGSIIQDIVYRYCFDQRLRAEDKILAHNATKVFITINDGLTLRVK